MKLPSVKNLAEGVAAVLKRFPFVMLFAFIGTVAASAYTELESTNRNSESWCCRFILIANLGLLLSLAVTLYTESKKTPAGRAILLKIIAVAFAFALIFLINPFEREADRTRFVLLSLAFHLLVAFAGFTAKGHVHGFWQFNKALFLRFLTGALYSAVLFLGISAAIGAMNFLFNFKFEWDTFVNLWIWIVGIFNTLFVLAGVPADLQALDGDVDYPKGLKVFTQYVLIPLATIYVVILLAYEAKILVQWNLPKGLVSNMVLGYAVFGILSILLVYPVREQEGNKWIKTYARSFYFLMLPLIVLLLLAVGTRVFRYGITESRYFLIMLACWLLFITVYFLVSKKQNIKMIPVSLCLLTLLTIYGPQSAFSVSMYSQQRILINIFKNNNAFKNDKLVPVDSVKISKKDGNKAAATLEYLVIHYDLTSIAPYLSANTEKLSDSLGRQKGKWNNNFVVERYELRRNKLTWAKKALGLNSFSGYDGRYGDVDVAEGGYPTTHEYKFTSTSSPGFNLDGYNYLVDTRFFGGTDSLVSNIDQLKIRQYNMGNNSCSIIINGERMSFDIKAHINELMKHEKTILVTKDTADKNTITQHYILPANTLDLTQEGKKYKVQFKIIDVNFGWTKNKGVEEINYINANYLIKIK